MEYGGIGKKIFATEFAKRILCQTKKNNCKCKSCIEFDSNNHPDFKVIVPNENSLKIEQIRELQKRIQEKPIISEKKVYIIDDADKMTNEAQNCLLKTLEEPPEFAIMILIGEIENSFLPTIKSRCMEMKFKPIENDKLKKYVEETYKININESNLGIFQGSIGKAIALKDKVQEYENVQELIDNLDRKDLIDIVKFAEPLYKTKEEILDILEYMNILLLERAERNVLYTNCIEIVESTKKKLKQNANYDMCIDSLLFRMWEELN